MLILRDRAEANVLGRSVISVGCWGGFAASSDSGRPAAAKGLFTADEEDAENGFNASVVFEGVEKGLSEVELEDGAVPNKVSPKFVAGLDFADSLLDPNVASSFRLSFAATSVVLMPRSARTLPSFRLQVLRRHARTYKRLSCPGKNSGRSPFNCRSRTVRSLHTLHLAKAADGGQVDSSQVWKQR